jgi:hypothetical protein
MKLVRLTDDAYVIEIEGSASPERVAQLRELWAEWWDSGRRRGPMIIGGEVVTFEDRSHPDFDARLRRIEATLGLEPESESVR